MDLKHFKLLKFLLVVAFAAGINAQANKEQDVIKELFENQQYDRRIRPGNGDEPVEVAVNMYLRSVTKLENNEFDVQLTYRQKWKDERLSYKSDIDFLTLVDPEKLAWIPDTFFSNENEAQVHSVMARNEFVRVSPDGQILQSARVSLKLSCPMNFRKFPMDRQVCPIRLASYAYRAQDVKYVWEDTDPIQIGKKIDLPVFTLESYETSNCMGTTKTGNYSCLIADFTFKRTFSPYLVSLYIPCCMMVLLSFTSFWISFRAVTARTVLLIFILVSFAGFVAQANKDFPQVGYTKAIDVWTGICLTFVFLAHLEFMTAQYIDRRTRQSKSSSSTDGDEEEQLPLKEDDSDIKKPDTPKTGKFGLPPRFFALYDSDSLSDKMDGLSRIIFPVTFVIFMIVYSIAYCPSSA